MQKSLTYCIRSPETSNHTREKYDTIWYEGSISDTLCGKFIKWYDLRIAADSFPGHNESKSHHFSSEESCGFIQRFIAADVEIQRFSFRLWWQQ